MSTAYQAKPTFEKKQEIGEFLKNSYWDKDIWDIRDPHFDDMRPKRLNTTLRNIYLSALSPSIKDEVKYMLARRLQEKELRLPTVINYSRAIKHLAGFIKKYYPAIGSIVDIPYEKALVQYRTFLIDRGMNINDEGRLSNDVYENLFKQLYFFFTDLYDVRDEYEKDVWDCRKIPGARFTENAGNHLLNFSDVPAEYRDLVKRYIRFRLTNYSRNQCGNDLMAIRLFTIHIHQQEPSWKDLTQLTRKHMEDFLSWFKGYSDDWIACHNIYLFRLKTFLDYIQRASYPEAPELPAPCLLFKEDIPRKSIITENDIKYIPEGVLQQLEDNLDNIDPAEYIPIVILIRASGWRISDILALRYDNCLDRTAQGWWLCGEIPKVGISNHRVPITDEVHVVVQAVVEEVKEKSTETNNPNHLLFVRFDGKRKGRCPQGLLINKALNRLSKKCDILDDQGQIFHFRNHAFRHTKGVELINNGMNILHVQKWMAHASPEMTLRYAKILDETMRKSWEEATKRGLFRVEESGQVRKIDISDIQNEDMIEWEYIRHNLDAVRMPLGYCMKPKKQECHSQLNPCLTCRNLCTTPDFIPQYELEIHETKALIERGEAQGRTVWVEKNRSLLGRYEEILTVLIDGKIHHKAGKKGREYVGEERSL